MLRNFTAERTKRVVNPEVPFAQGLPAALASALRAVPGSLWCSGPSFRSPANALCLRAGPADARTLPALVGFTGLRRLGLRVVVGLLGLIEKLLKRHTSPPYFQGGDQGVVSNAWMRIRNLLSISY